MTLSGLSTRWTDRQADPDAEPAAVAPRREWQPQIIDLGWRLWLLRIWWVTLGLHVFRYRESYDLFIDEPFYTQVGQAVARGEFPRATGSLFFLHPPGFFLLEGGWIAIFGAHNNVFAQVYSIRLLVALIVASSAVLFGIIARSVLPRGIATLVVAVYVINTYMQRETSLVLLEPAALCWTLAGYVVLLRLRSQSRARWLQLAVVGVMFGMACLSKEFAVFVTLVPLAVMGVLRWQVTRREAALTIGVVVSPFVSWVAVLSLAGHWHVFWHQLSQGFARAAGATQVSGFNQPGTPSFISTLVANTGSLWTTYLILGAGSLAAAWLAWRQGLSVWIRAGYRHVRTRWGSSVHLGPGSHAGAWLARSLGLAQRIRAGYPFARVQPAATHPTDVRPTGVGANGRQGVSANGRQGPTRRIRAVYPLTNPAGAHPVTSPSPRGLPPGADRSSGPGNGDRSDRAQLAANYRVLSAFGLGAILLLAYCVVAGANEEQFFMFLFPPALLCLAVVVHTRERFVEKPWRIAVAVVVAVVLLSDSVQYVRDHTTPDQGTYAVDQWMGKHVALRTRVAVTNAVQREIFIRYDMVNDKPGLVLQANTRYLVVFSRQVDLGYAFVDRATIDRQTANMKEVFAYSDRSNGRIVVYERR